MSTSIKIWASLVFFVNPPDGTHCQKCIGSKNGQHFYLSCRTWTVVYNFHKIIVKIEIFSHTKYTIQTNTSKLHCQRALLFHHPKVAPPIKGICWMKIVNKASFELDTPPGVIFAFYMGFETPNLYHLCIGYTTHGVDL